MSKVAPINKNQSKTVSEYLRQVAEEIERGEVKAARAVVCVCHQSGDEMSFGTWQIGCRNFLEALGIMDSCRQDMAMNGIYEDD